MYSPFWTPSFYVYNSTHINRHVTAWSLRVGGAGCNCAALTCHEVTEVSNGSVLRGSRAEQADVQASVRISCVDECMVVHSSARIIDSE